MATEAEWQVQPSNFPNGGATVYNSPPYDIYGDTTQPNLEGGANTVRESRYVQIGSYLLYAMKEYLVKSGWTVVQTSYRDKTKEAYYASLGGEQAGGFWSPTNSNKKTQSDPNPFSVTNYGAVDADAWLPSYGASGGSEFNDSDNPAYSVIYPGYVPVRITNQNAAFYDALKRKGLFSVPVNAGGTAREIGRSWCLLKAPDYFKEPGDTKSPTDPTRTHKGYHIVLDYVHSAIPRWLSGLDSNDNYPVFVPTDYEELGRNFALTANTLNFGAFINIVVLPDYDPTGADGLSNLAHPDTMVSPYTPDSRIRPSHYNEISYAPRENDSGIGGKFFKLIDDSSQKYFINMINTTSSVGSGVVDPAKGGTIILGSASGQPKFSIVMNSIADPLSQEIVKKNKTNQDFAGQKYFFFWSNTERGNNNSSAGFCVKSISPTQLLGSQLKNTIFDSREEASAIYYFYNYSPEKTAGSKFDSRNISSCIPAFQAEINIGISGPQLLMSTTPVSKATADYTYTEWPLPLIAIQGFLRNYNYVGRMMDIKLGPASAPSGILALDETTQEYDRILFNGLWYPYSGTDTLLF